MVNPSSSNTSENAIILSKTIVAGLRTAVAKDAGPLDEVGSPREMLDDVVQQMIDCYYYQGSTQPFVYYGGPHEGDTYKWFKSDVARNIQACEQCKDKGRFVEAMVLLYLMGDAATQYLVSSRRVRPQSLSDSQEEEIRNALAAMPAAKDCVSTFIPTTHKQLPTDT